MLCRDPYSPGGGVLYPCGRCRPCRINRRRLWTHRIILESRLHRTNGFFSLTYSDDHLPISSTNLPNLNPKHLQDWLKRYRAAISPSRMRFYAVGEYGDESQRPHYHVVAFGVGECCRGRTLRRPGSSRPQWAACCQVCRLVGETWGLGDVDLGSVTVESAQYCAGYTVKKMTQADDFRLLGRHPEFARMSLKNGGIGSGFMKLVAEKMMSLGLDKRQVDVPSSLAHGRKELPLGRYLMRTLRKELGRDASTPAEVLEAIALELRPLREAAFNNSRSFKKEVVNAGNQKVLNMETKAKIHKKGFRL
ncbi:replication initiator protein [Apis mellifera associated microvirus 41]|nr:replication initiator protein [Apis mellifera associated microvirus 41]